MSERAHNHSAPDERKLETILSGIDRLPTLPSVATRLMSVSSAADIDLDEIIRLIESDPAMSTTILRLCRTAEKGLGDRITTVRRAVIMLGLETVQVASLSVHVYQQLAGEDQESTFDRSGFWIHSLCVACAAERIARSYPSLGVSPDEAYIAGLLHDLGKVALDLVLPKAYGRVLEMAQSKRCALCLVERAMLGIDHHTAGKRLAEHWGLPDQIRDAMWLHAQPLDSIPHSESRPLVSIVTLAESWSRDLHLGWCGDYGEPIDCIDFGSQLGVNPGFFKEHAPGILEQVSVRAEALGLGEHARQDLLVESLTGANRRLAQLNSELRVKTRQSLGTLRVLDAVDAFLESLPHDAPTEKVLGAMVRSASVLVGSQRGAVIYQKDAKSPWQRMLVDGGEIVQRPARVQAPNAGEMQSRPALLSESGFVAGLDLSELTWLRELFASVREAGMPMLIGSGSDAGDQRPSYLIVMPMTGSGSEKIVATPEFERVRRLWTRTLMQSIEAEQAKRMGEELASANHAMAALRHEITSKESLVQLGKLSAGAAHEMNNPLSIILGRSQQLFERVGTQKERDIARTIADAAQQLADLISALHQIADPPKPCMHPGDPVLLVREAIEMARQRCYTAGVRARIQFNAKGFFDPVNMDIPLLAQAIAEPIINAVQAQPGEVVLVSIEPDPHFGRLTVRISDQGRGFSENTLRHAFDPFFSELPAGRRTGLGLTRARGLVELHRGEIELENRSGGKGACVLIHLPTAQTAAEAA